MRPVLAAAGSRGGDSKFDEEDFDDASTFSIEAVSQVLCWRDLASAPGGLGATRDLAADGDALAAIACEMMKSASTPDTTKSYPIRSLLQAAARKQAGDAGTPLEDLLRVSTGTSSLGGSISLANAGSDSAAGITAERTFALAAVVALKVLLRSQRDGVFDSLAEALHAGVVGGHGAPPEADGQRGGSAGAAPIAADPAFGLVDASGAPAVDPLIAEGLISAEDAPMPVQLEALAKAFGAAAAGSALGKTAGSTLEIEKALSLRAVVCLLHGASTLPGHPAARRVLAARVAGAFAVHALGPLPLTNAQLLAMAGARQAQSPGGPQGPPGMAQMASEQVLRPVRFEVRARSDLL